MTELLANYIGGAWVQGTDAGTALFDPITDEELVRVSGVPMEILAWAHSCHARQRRNAPMGHQSSKVVGEALASARLPQVPSQSYGSFGHS